MKICGRRFADKDLRTRICGRRFAVIDLRTKIFGRSFADEDLRTKLRGQRFMDEDFRTANFRWNKYKRRSYLQMRIFVTTIFLGYEEMRDEEM